MNHFAKPFASLAILWVVFLGGFFSLSLITPVYAQARSISGDDVCGASSSTKCTFSDAKNIARGFMTTLVIPIGSALLVVFIIFRVLMAQKALMEGNTNAYKEAGKKITNAIFSFVVMIIVLAGALLGILKFLGVKDAYTIFLSYGQVQHFENMLVSAFITTAHAQSSYLDNPVGVDSLYDFILLIVRLFIRWFVFPCIIFMWVWTGFAFVAAQGRPDELVKAKKWLLWSIIATVVIAMTEGFLFAIRGTVNAILPQAVRVIEEGKTLLAMIQK